MKKQSFIFSPLFLHSTLFLLAALLKTKEATTGALLHIYIKYSVFASQNMLVTMSVCILHQPTSAKFYAWDKLQV